MTQKLRQNKKQQAQCLLFLLNYSPFLVVFFAVEVDFEVEDFDVVVLLLLVEEVFFSVVLEAVFLVAVEDFVLEAVDDLDFVVFAPLDLAVVDFLVVFLATGASATGSSCGLFSSST